MIIGLGIDQIEIARVERVWRRYGERFGRRVYTQQEWQYCLSLRRPAESLAGRFAAKEAAMKALGLGWPGGIAYKDIEITRERTGKPALRLTRTAAERAARIDMTHATVSMTHNRDVSAATVIFENSESRKS